MAFPTANVRIKTGPFGLFTIRGYLDAPLKSRCNGPDHLPMQPHEFASVSPDDGGYRAGKAQTAGPG